MTGEQRDPLRGRLILNLKVCFVKCRRSGCDARDTNSMTGYQRHVPVYTCSQSSSSCLFERATVSFEPFFWSFGIIRGYQHAYPQLCAIKCWSHFWRYRSRTWVVDEPAHWHWFSRLGGALVSPSPNVISGLSNSKGLWTYRVPETIARFLCHATCLSSPLGLSSNSRLNLELGGGRGGSMCLLPRSCGLQGDITSSSEWCFTLTCISRWASWHLLYLHSEDIPPGRMTNVELPSTQGQSLVRICRFSNRYADSSFLWSFYWLSLGGQGPLHPLGTTKSQSKPGWFCNICLSR